jgi:hypothetical protein
VSILLLAYFILSYHYGDVIGGGFRDDGTVSSGYTDSRVDDERTHSHSGFGRLAAVGAAGAGLAALAGRRRSRSRSRVDLSGGHSGTDGRTTTTHHEKRTRFEDDERRGDGIMGKLAKVGVVVGGLALAKNLFGGRKDRHDDERIRPTAGLGGVHSLSTDETESGLEEGRPMRPHDHRPGSGTSDSYTDSSYLSDLSPPKRHGMGTKIGEGVATLGAFGLLRAAIQGRKDKREQKRIDQIRRKEIEDEELARRESNRRRRFTGDGAGLGGRRRTSYNSESDLTETTDGRHPPLPANVPPIPTSGPILGGAGIGPATTAAAGALAAETLRHDSGSRVQMPPAPADPQGVLHGIYNSSGSEVYEANDGRRKHRHHLGEDAALAAGGAAVGATIAESSRRRRDERHDGSPHSQLQSPPVSIRMTQHSDGRHVTLRRLSEQEAAAERAARHRDRRERSSSRHHRTGPAGPGSGVGSGVGTDLSGSDRDREREHWRRAEERERRDLDRNTVAANTAANAGLPPPPPIGSGIGGPRPGPNLGTGPVGSSGRLASPGAPGTTPGGNLGAPSVSHTADTGYTGSATDAAENRRRRRAERAQQAYRTDDGGVEWT